MYLKAICISLLLLMITESETLNDTNQDHKTKYLQQSSILFALSTFAPNEQINPTCSNQLEQLKEQSLNKSAWAMKMLDASGRSLPGFLFGQNYWLGDREICETVQKPLQLLLTERHKHNMHWGILNETAPYDVGFSVAYLEHTSPWQVEVNYIPIEGLIQIGLCVPVACKIDDLKWLIEQFLSSDFQEINDFYELKAKLFYIKQPSGRWLPSSKFFQSSSFVLLACLTISTLLLMLWAAILKRQHCKGSGKIRCFVKCFDLSENFKQIFTVNNTREANDISVINGLRVVVSIVIVLFHVAFFSLPVVTNRSMVFANIASNGSLLTHVVVDFFFIISGFLQAYKFLSSPRQLESIGEASGFTVCKEFLKKVFHRWLRLAPLIYTIVCLHVSIVIFANENSVYHIFLREDLNFQKYWWRCLLFIQNMFNGTDTFALWTWSMCCEMQFFIAGTLLLLLYAKKPNVSKACFLAVLAANFGFYYYNGITDQYGLNLDDFTPNTMTMYVNPLVRCTPYLLGMFCGWYLAAPQRQFHLRTECVIGNVAFFVVLLLLVLLRDSRIPHGAAATTVLLIARISVGIWTNWLIAAALKNSKTWLSSFLELSCFRPLARLSYAFYLIHPCIITFVAFTTNTGLHLDNRILAILYFGFVVVSYIGAVICSLAVEMPYCNLSSLIMKRKF